MSVWLSATTYLTLHFSQVHFLRLTAQLHSLTQTLYHLIMGNKQNSKKHTTATGTQKSKKITKRTHGLEAPKVASAQPQPCPHPAYGKAKANKHADDGEEHGEHDLEVARAAEVLLSMQNASNMGASTPSKSHIELTFKELDTMEFANEPKDEEDADTISSDEPDLELSSDDCEQLTYINVAMEPTLKFLI
jgi:hypothetical protein